MREGGLTKTQIILSIALILLAFAVRLHNLAGESLWFDEIQTTDVVAKGWAAVEGRRDHPGLYFLITAGIYDIIGGTEFSVRFSSLIWGTLAIPLMILAGRTLGRTTVGLWAALLLALSPFHLRYSQEARMYAQLMTFSLLSFIFLYWALKRPGWKNWLLFSMATILNLYTHFGALLVLASQSVLIAIWAADHLVKGQRKGLLWPIYSAFLVILLYLPMIPRFIGSLGYNIGAQTITDTGTRQTFAIWLTTAFRDFGMFDQGRAILLLSLCTLGLVLLIIGKRWFDISWILTGLLLPVVLIYLFQVARGAYSRYIIYLLPFYLIPVALVLDRALVALNRRVKNGAYGWGSAALALAFIWLAWPGVEQEYRHIDQDWWGVVNYLDENATDGDVILATTMNMPFNVVGAGLPVYLEDAQGSYQLVQGNFVELEQAAGLKNSQGDVWAVVSQWAEPLTFSDPSLEVTEFQTYLHVVHDMDAGGNLLEKVIALYEQLLTFATMPEPRCLLQQDLGTLNFAAGNYQKTAQMIADSAGICPEINASAREILAGYLDEAKLVEQLAIMVTAGDVVIGLAATLPDTKHLEASAFPTLLQESDHAFSYIRGEKPQPDNLGTLAREEGGVWFVVWHRNGPALPNLVGFEQVEFGDGLSLLRDRQAGGTVLEQLVTGRERLASQKMPSTTLCLLDQQIAFSYGALRQFDPFYGELDGLITGCMLGRSDEASLSQIEREILLGINQFYTELLLEGDLANAREVAERLVTLDLDHPDAPDLPAFTRPLAEGDMEKARSLAAETLTADPQNPEALALLTFQDLLKRFAGGEALIDEENVPEPVEVRQFVMPHDGQWGEVIFAHPPAAVSFPVELPDDPVALQTRIALDPQSWGWDGDGVTFIVTLQVEGQPPTELFRAHLANDDSGRDWQDVLVPLAPYAGRPVRLTLATDPGPQGDGDGDWAGWDSPRLIWQP